MKRKQASILFKLTCYFVLFAIVVLLLLWLFQVVLFEGFYKSIKIQKIQAATANIASHMEDQDIEPLILEEGKNNEACIRVVDGAYREFYSVEYSSDCIIHKLQNLEIYQYYLKAKDNRGMVVEIIDHDLYFVGESYWGHSVELEGVRDSTGGQSILCVQLVETSGGGELLVMLNSTITPVSTTVEAIRIQLTIVTVVMVVLSCLLAFLLSRSVAKPIVSINEAAKQLAKSNYAVQFDASGYKEVQELSDTLGFAAAELSKVEKLRQELIANISHDLRTPLTMIKGYGEVMRDIPGENTPENIQIIVDEAGRLGDLVTDLLDLSKLQSGTQSLNLTTFNLTADIKSIMKRYGKLTEQDGYDIQFSYAEEVQVLADEIKISQVVYNLINNAINYVGEDKQVLVKQVVDGDKVRIEVCDHGCGIAKEDLPYIWDRYYKVDKTHKRSVIGTGLGLSIAKSVLLMHQAQFGVESEKGKGSTFWFELYLDQ